MRGALLLVDKVADQKIQLRVLCRKVAEGRKNLVVALGIDPVIGIDHLEKDAARVFKTGHNRGAVSAVHLVQGAADIRVFPLVAVRDFSGVVLLRAVVDN